MKSITKLPSAMSLIAFLLATGCDKHDEQASGSPVPGAPAAAATVEKTVPDAPVRTEQVVQQAQDVIANAQAATSAATGQVQATIDQAKNLIGEKKWSDAMALLSTLSGQQLSTDQQSTVQGLRAQAQKGAEAALSAKTTEGANKTVGGLLQK